MNLQIRAWICSLYVTINVFEIVLQKQSSQQIVEGQACDVWQLIVTEGRKTNKYTMWVKQSQGDEAIIPVKYEMMGFDSLIGSHFDKYVLEYFQYDTSSIPEAMFEPPQSEFYEILE